MESNVAAVRGNVSSHSHSLTAHEVDSIEVVSRRVAFDETIRDVRQMYSAPETVLARVRCVR